MQVSEATLNKLKNFSGINNSILFKKGTILQTVTAPSKTILAETTLDFEVPQDFAIYDLSMFLACLSLFKERQLEINDGYGIIGVGKSKIRYRFAEATMIDVAPYKSIKFPDPIAECTIPNVDKFIKAGSILGSTDFSLVGSDGTVTAICESLKDKGSNTFSEEVGNTDVDFKVSIKMIDLRFMNVPYQVKITDKKIIQFASDTVNYWVACNAE